jgi:undecaprenyl diphosphate synthase
MPAAAPQSAGRSAVPQHVAVIMDGNGRWAEQRSLPRAAGHRAGAKAVRTAIEESVRHGVGALTLFAFSSENWQRPAGEVGLLMQLFLESLDREVAELDANSVRIRFIGDRARLAPALVERMTAAEARTARHRRLDLVIAVAYGGRWDIAQAARHLAIEAAAGRVDPAANDRLGDQGHRVEALGGLPDLARDLLGRRSLSEELPGLAVAAARCEERRGGGADPG